MTSKLVPANPEDVMVIREPIPGITTLSVPFLRFGRIRIGGRATIVRLPSGSLAVFSPVALTPTVRNTLGSAPVSYLIAPDLEHHIFLSSWSSAFPSAKIIAPGGLPEKRATQNATDKSVTLLDFHTVFTAENKLTTKIGGEFDEEFDYEFVDAHSNKELVFYHRRTKTMIEADLLFNLPATEQYSKSGESAQTGVLSKIFGALMNTHGSAWGQKRLIWYGMSKTRESMRESVGRMAKWDIQNIVPCHGDVIVGGGDQVFRKLFDWFLEGKKKN